MQSPNTAHLKAYSFAWQLVFSFHSDHHIVGLGCFGKIIGGGGGVLWQEIGGGGSIKRVNIMVIYFFIFLLTHHVTVILRKCRHILQVQLHV